MAVSFVKSQLFTHKSARHMSMYLCPALYELCAIALGLLAWVKRCSCALSNGGKRWHQARRKRRAIESRTKAQKKEMFTTLGRHINLRMKSCAFRPLSKDSQRSEGPHFAETVTSDLPPSHVIVICHWDLWFFGSRQTARAWLSLSRLLTSGPKKYS